MSSEPIEAGFARPPALTTQQDEEFRVLNQEEGFGLGKGLIVGTPTTISRQSTHVSRRDGLSNPTVNDLARIHTKEGYRIVEFDKGTGEDPREWSHPRKWCVVHASDFSKEANVLKVCDGYSVHPLSCSRAGQFYHHRRVRLFWFSLWHLADENSMRGPAKEFNESQTIINLTVTCFVMGFGLGYALQIFTFHRTYAIYSPLFLSPLSEVIGRRPVYMGSMFMYFIFTLPSCLAKNTATLVIGRMIASLAASAPMCNIGGRYVILMFLNLCLSHLVVLPMSGSLKSGAFRWPCSPQHYCKMILLA